jgi:methylamine--corrinoid protein Co-methyltransferase
MRPNLLTPLEIELCSEVAKGTVKNKITREEANRILVESWGPILKPVYDASPRERSAMLKGKTFEELYDLNTLKPKKDYLESYRNARRELKKMGVKFEW